MTLTLAWHFVGWAAAKLERAGLVERYGIKRLRVTDAGRAIDLSNTEESETY